MEAEAIMYDSKRENADQTPFTEYFYPAEQILIKSNMFEKFGRSNITTKYFHNQKELNDYIDNISTDCSMNEVEPPASEEIFFDEYFNKIDEVKMKDGRTYVPQLTRTKRTLLQLLSKYVYDEKDSIERAKRKREKRIQIIRGYLREIRRKRYAQTYKRFVETKAKQLNLTKEAMELCQRELVDKKLDDKFYIQEDEPDYYKNLQKKRREAILTKYITYLNDAKFREDYMKRVFYNIGQDFPPQYKFRTVLTRKKLTYDDTRPIQVDKVDSTSGTEAEQDPVNKLSERKSYKENRPFLLSSTLRQERQTTPNRTNDNLDIRNRTDDVLGIPNTSYTVTKNETSGKSPLLNKTFTPERSRTPSRTIENLESRNRTNDAMHRPVKNNETFEKSPVLNKTFTPERPRTPNHTIENLESSNRTYHAPPLNTTFSPERQTTPKGLNENDITNTPTDRKNVTFIESSGNLNSTFDENRKTTPHQNDNLATLNQTYDGLGNFENTKTFNENLRLNETFNLQPHLNSTFDQQNRTTNMDINLSKLPDVEQKSSNHTYNADEAFEKTFDIYINEDLDFISPRPQNQTFNKTFESNQQNFNSAAGKLKTSSPIANSPNMSEQIKIYADGNSPSPIKRYIFNPQEILKPNSTFIAAVDEEAKEIRSTTNRVHEVSSDVFFDATQCSNPNNFTSDEIHESSDISDEQLSYDAARTGPQRNKIYHSTPAHYLKNLIQNARKDTVVSTRSLFHITEEDRTGRMSSVLEKTVEFAKTYESPLRGKININYQTQNNETQEYDENHNLTYSSVNHSTPRNVDGTYEKSRSNRNRSSNISKTFDGNQTSNFEDESSDGSLDDDNVASSEEEFISSYDEEEFYENWPLPQTRKKRAILEELQNVDALGSNNYDTPEDRQRRRQHRMQIIKRYQENLVKQRRLNALRRVQTVLSLGLSIRDSAAMLKSHELKDKKLHRDYYHAPNEPQIFRNLLEKRRRAIDRKYEQFVMDEEYRQQLYDKTMNYDRPIRLKRRHSEILEALDLQLPQSVTHQYETLNPNYTPPEFQDNDFDRSELLERSYDFGYRNLGDKKEFALYKTMIDDEQLLAKKRDRKILLGRLRPNASCFANVEMELYEPVYHYPDKSRESLYDYKLDHFDHQDKYEYDL